MNTESDFLAALKFAPDDALLRSAFADFLEERSDPRSRYLRDDLIRPWMGVDFGDPLPSLIDAVRNNRKFANARKALVAVGAAAVMPMATLLTEEMEIRERAEKVLGAMGETARPAVPALLTALETGDGDDLACAKALVAIRPGPDTDTGPLVRAQSLPYEAVVAAIRRVLSGMGAIGSATDEVLRRLHDSDEDERAAAVTAVANLGTKAAVSRLWPSLSDPSPMVRSFAVEAVAKFPSDPRTEGALLAALADPDDEVRTAAALGVPYEPGPAVVERLCLALTDACANVRYAAIHSLRKAAWLEHYPVDDIARLVRDPSPLVREEVVEALGDGAARMEPVALAALLTALEDESATIVVAACRAMHVRQWLPPSAERPLRLAHARILREIEDADDSDALTALGLVESPEPQTLALIRDALDDDRMAGAAVHAVWLLGSKAASLAGRIVERLRADPTFHDGVAYGVSAAEAVRATEDEAAIATLANLERESVP